MLLVSVICILGIVFREPAYVTVATTLVAIPVAFTSLETLNKKWKHGAEAGAENGNG